MNIAILIYGRLNKAVTHYDNIISNISDIEKIKNIDFFCSSDNSNDIEEFISKYNPKDYINDKIIIDENDLNIYLTYPKPLETNVENVIRHFINKKRVYEIFEKYINSNNLKYDIVISLRIDANISNKFIFENPKSNTIYIPNGHDYRNGINDQIAYGNQDVMKKYFSIIDNCKLILEKNISTVGFHPENLTLANIKLHELEISRFELEYNIIR
jgi:hypothetical protein